MEKITILMLLFCFYVTIDAKIDIQVVKKCLFKCPKIMKPVCGSDGKMYNNACLLKTASCEQKKLILKISRCPKLYRPVCGSDGKRYENMCELALASCRVAEGVHRLAGCPRNLEPVCGSDGEKYDNKCLLKLAACQQGKDITVIKCKE